MHMLVYNKKTYLFSYVIIIYTLYLLLLTLLTCIVITIKIGI